MRQTPIFTAAALAIGLSACAPEGAPPPANEPPEAEMLADETGMQLTSVAAGDRITSPLNIEGSAPGTWYYEGVFPVRLVDGEGNTIAEGLVDAQSNWMTEEQVAFRGELSFDVDQPVEAELLLQEDSPGPQTPMEYRIDVTLVPSG